MAGSTPHKSAQSLLTSTIVLHGLVHPLSQRWMFDRRKQKSQHKPLRLSVQLCSPFLTASQSFLAIVCLCFCACTTRICSHWGRSCCSVTHTSHAFYNAEATVLLPLAFPPRDIFSLSSINQIPRPAELRKRNRACEETEKDTLLHRFGELPTDTCLLRRPLTGAGGKLLISGSSLFSGLEKCQPLSAGPLNPLHDQHSH